MPLMYVLQGSLRETNLGSVQTAETTGADPRRVLVKKSRCNKAFHESPVNERNMCLELQQAHDAERPQQPLPFMRLLSFETDAATDAHTLVFELARCDLLALLDERVEAMEARKADETLSEDQPKTRPPLSAHEVMPLFRDALMAVLFLHEHGVAHLDLSLENLLLDFEGRVRLCDLGLARRFDPERPHHINVTRGGQKSVAHPYDGCMIGKPSFATPRFWQARPVDAFLADAWSLGVVLFGLLTGRAPFAEPLSSDAHFRALQPGRASQTLRAWYPRHMLEPKFAQGMQLVQQLWWSERRPSRALLTHPFFED